MTSRHIISGLAVLLSGMMAVEAVDQARTFGTPEEAVKALSVASSAKDDAALRAIFGPDYDQIKDPDPAQAARDLAVFEAAITQTNRIVRQSDTNCIVEIGTNSWPFPIPLVKQGDQWHFDTASGKEETAEPANWGKRAVYAPGGSHLCGCAARICQPSP